MVEPQIEPAHDVARIGDTGEERNALARRGPGERFGEAGRDHEFRPRFDHRRQIFLVGDRARADHRAIDLLHRPDRIERGRGAQRDFERAQSARDQRPREGDGVLQFVDHDHGHNRGEAHDIGDSAVG